MVSGDTILQCATLRHACVTLKTSQPTCSSRCSSSQRPFRIDVYGKHATRDIETAVSLLRYIKDPLNAFVLRHLERDLFVAPHVKTPPTTMSREPAHMLWPEWESGFSDVLMGTLLPLGYMAHIGQLPNTTWMISGALVSRAWEPLVAMSRGGVCTVERDLQIEDVIVSNPLPRCPQNTCDSRLSLCQIVPNVVTHTKSWKGRMALDMAMGLPLLPLHASLVHSSNISHAKVRELTVLFAKRHSWHGRHILNQRELIDSCAARNPTDVRLRCMEFSFNRGSLVETAWLMRSVDVLVGMHGGDLINAMHMRPGCVLIEVVNHGFHLAADSWLNQYWLHTSPILRHVRIVLPPPKGASEGSITPVDVAWNANASLPVELFWQALDATTLFAQPLRHTSSTRKVTIETTACPRHSQCFGHYQYVDRLSQLHKN